MKRVEVRALPEHVYAVAINDGRYEIIADEDLESGGEDMGPQPYELLLGALGACMVITMKMYAGRKQWPLESVSIALTHDKVPAAECAACTPEEIAAVGPQGRVDVIHTDISITGGLSPEQVARLHEISGRCPVHRTLEARPKFVSSIAHHGA